MSDGAYGYYLRAISVGILLIVWWDGSIANFANHQVASDRDVDAPKKWHRKDGGEWNWVG